MKLPVNRLNAVMLVVAGATGACAAAGDTGVDDGSDIQSLASASIESCDQVVRPGESIQAALDRAAEGSTVYVEPGVYRETANALNGLTITRGVHLIGRARFGQKVVLENSGAQANGIVVVPPDHTDCMSCHSSLASPFPLRAGVVRASTAEEHVIRDLEIQGITIRNFTANGIFTRSVDGFRIDNVHSVNNPEYGVFPILSKNGTISRSSATGANDTGFWVETSENVDVIGNLAEGNVAGFQVSNSDNVRFIDNIARKNSIGVATFLLPNIFAVKSDTQRITIKNNRIYDNNRPNTANSILAAVPSGTGILHLGADDSRIVGNDVRNNDFAGIGVADYCIVAEGTRFGCSEPHVTPEFIAESEATKNMIGWNTLVDNGKNPDPSHPFAFAASDLALITSGDHGNCYTGNNFGTSFSTIGGLPACP